MWLKGVVYEDFINYKKPSMFLIFPSCTFKCDIENGCQLCQNSKLVEFGNTYIEPWELVQNYINNPITSSIVCGGLEPMDSFEDLDWFISLVRCCCDDDIVIYTGYNKDEIEEEIALLKDYKNIIIKYGRFRPNQDKHFDNVLGVNLANDEQYAERIS